MNTEHMNSPCCKMSPSIPSVPLPMAFFGMLVAFMFGAACAIMKSRQHQMMGHAGCCRPRMHRSMESHHHHGEGAPCCESHDDWTQNPTPPAEQ